MQLSNSQNRHALHVQTGSTGWSALAYDFKFLKNISFSTISIMFYVKWAEQAHFLTIPANVSAF